MSAILEVSTPKVADLDIDIDIMSTSDTGPMITSVILCTAGCTSDGGGSQCSWCC